MKKEIKYFEDDYLDGDGYPTEKFLDYIKNYDGQHCDVIALLSQIADAWWGEAFYIHGSEKVEAHTVGWSGNEEIMDALFQNKTLVNKVLIPKRHEAGGHFYFDLKS